MTENLDFEKKLREHKEVLAKMYLKIKEKSSENSENFKSPLKREEKMNQVELVTDSLLSDGR